MAGIIALQIIAYASLLAFAVFVTVRVVRYAVMPMHLRWELYPVAHETGHPSGGSYFENLDWWAKLTHNAFMGELIFMGSELLCFTHCYLKKRGFWYCVYPFHNDIKGPFLKWEWR